MSNTTFRSGSTGQFPDDTSNVPPDVKSDDFTEQVVRRVGMRSTMLDFFTMVFQGFLGILKGFVGVGNETDRMSTK